MNTMFRRMAVKGDGMDNFEREIKEQFKSGKMCEEHHLFRHLNVLDDLLISITN